MPELSPEEFKTHLDLLNDDDAGKEERLEAYGILKKFLDNKRDSFNGKDLTELEELALKALTRACRGAAEKEIEITKGEADELGLFAEEEVAGGRKGAMIELILQHDFGQIPSKIYMDSLKEDLRAELVELKLGALYQRAKAAGVEQAALAAADDEDDPRAAIVRLMLPEPPVPSAASASESSRSRSRTRLSKSLGGGGRKGTRRKRTRRKGTRVKVKRSRIKRKGNTKRRKNKRRKSTRKISSKRRK